jgi:hypothetical protein
MDFCLIMYQRHVARAYGQRIPPLEQTGYEAAIRTACRGPNPGVSASCEQQLWAIAREADQVPVNGSVP